MDDHQQGLIPPGADPRIMEYDPETHEMPDIPSLIDTMRQDMSPKVETWTAEPMSPERASTPTIGFRTTTRRMNRLLYRESEKCPHIPAHTQIHLSYARALVQPCSLHGRAPRRSHRLRLR